VNLVGSAQFLALYKVLQRKGIGKDESGIVSLKIFPKIIRAWYEALEDMPRSDNGTNTAREEVSFGEKMRRWALTSQKRLYPGDWVYEFLERNGKDFDSGTDMLECGILKFYKEHDMADLVPYQCAWDIPMSEVGKQGLHRTKTLADGGDKCDFRFKMGRETEVNSTVWNDEFNL